MKNPNTKEYWDKEFKSGKFGDATHALRRTKQYRFLVNILPKDKKFSLFEIGCASGYGLEFIGKNFPLAELYGLDFSEVAVEKAKKKYPKINFKAEDIQDYKFVRKYNYIAIIRTLEHLSEPFAVVDECLKYATNAVIITLPGTANHPWHVNLFDLHDFDNYVFDELSGKQKKLTLVIYKKKNV